MTPAEPYAEMLACFHMFRSIGVEADDIYASCDGTQALMIVKQGDRAFVVKCGEFVSIAEDEFKRDWTAAGTWWNNAGTAEEDRQKLWQSSQAAQSAMAIWNLLLTRGFVVRGSRDWTVAQSRRER